MSPNPVCFPSFLLSTVRNTFFGMIQVSPSPPPPHTNRQPQLKLKIHSSPPPYIRCVLFCLFVFFIYFTYYTLITRHMSLENTYVAQATHFTNGEDKGAVRGGYFPQVAPNSSHPVARLCEGVHIPCLLFHSNQ